MPIEGSFDDFASGPVNTSQISKMLSEYGAREPEKSLSVYNKPVGSS